jgi:hypothetical protein
MSHETSVRLNQLCLQKCGSTDLVQHGCKTVRDPACLIKSRPARRESKYGEESDRFMHHIFYYTLYYYTLLNYPTLKRADLIFHSHARAFLFTSYILHLNAFSHFLFNGYIFIVKEIEIFCSILVILLLKSV